MLLVLLSSLAISMKHINQIVKRAYLSIFLLNFLSVRSNLQSEQHFLGVDNFIIWLYLCSRELTEEFSSCNVFFNWLKCHSFSYNEIWGCGVFLACMYQRVNRAKVRTVKNYFPPSRYFFYLHVRANMIVSSSNSLHFLAFCFINGLLVFLGFLLLFFG